MIAPVELCPLCPLPSLSSPFVISQPRLLYTGRQGTDQQTTMKLPWNYLTSPFSWWSSWIRKWIPPPQTPKKTSPVSPHRDGIAGIDQPAPWHPRQCSRGGVSKDGEAGWISNQQINSRFLTGWWFSHPTPLKNLSYSQLGWWQQPVIFLGK